MSEDSSLRKRKMGTFGEDPDSDEKTKVPEYGLRVKMNHVYPENRSQNFVPCLRIIWIILPLVLRYIWCYIKSKFTGKSIVMDYVKVQRSKQCYGVPLGGIGCGSIGRGFKGEFTRFQLRPGLYEYNTVDADQFIVTIKDEHQETIFHSLLSTYKTKGLSEWKSNLDPTKCKYTGLYPRAWMEYDLSEYGVILKCRQISPIIRKDTQTSALPVAVFVWNIHNVANQDRTVTIAFTFKNGTGNTKLDKASTCSSKSFRYFNRTEGVALHHTIDNMACTYALGVKVNEHFTISKCLQFDPNSSGIKPWIQLKNNGGFDKNFEKDSMHTVGEVGVGIACKTTITPDTWDKIEMSLSWDMPTVYFGKKGKKYRRFYTEQFGVENAAVKIVDYALGLYEDWDKLIYEWQSPVLNNKTLPDWYKSALFNESYFMSDGGSVWFALDKEEKEKLDLHDPRLTVGRFAYLEGHEYKMYNSYDVHFYASHALSQNFPDLQRALQYDLRDCVALEIPDKVEMLFDGQYVERKVPNTVPHDIGDPGEDPFLLPNAYPIHDVSHWRDLNSKFVLQTYRDAFNTENGQVDMVFLKDMYDTCYIVMRKLQEYDEDGDGLIENSGTPDQTFDIWTMTGASAYCGGLWLAALYVMTEMSKLLNKDEDYKKFQNLLEKGKVSFERKLWNGQYYNFDCSQKQAQSIMADQLCFQWYLRCCGIKNYPIIPKENVVNTLKTIYEYNVQSFCDGTMGAVNGFLGGDVDTFAVQSEEVWTGVTYALAANLIFEGMLEEGFVTAGGMYRSMRDTFGLAFDTPEALYAKKYYRSIGYMRPLSIWSMQIALDEMQKHQS